MAHFRGSPPGALRRCWAVMALAVLAVGVIAVAPRAEAGPPPVRSSGMRPRPVRTAAGTRTVAYLESPAEHLVLEVDAKTGELGRSFHVPGLSTDRGFVQSLAISADGTTLWVATLRGVVPIDLVAGVVGTEISLGAPVTDVVLSPAGDKLWAVTATTIPPSTERYWRATVAIDVHPPYTVGPSLPAPPGSRLYGDGGDLAAISPNGAMAIVESYDVRAGDPLEVLTIVDLTGATAPKEVTMSTWMTRFEALTWASPSRVYGVMDGLGWVAELDVASPTPAFTPRHLDMGRAGVLESSHVDPANPAAFYVATCPLTGCSPGGKRALTRVDTSAWTLGTPVPLSPGLLDEDFGITPDGRNALMVGHPDSGVGTVQPVDLSTGTAHAPVPILPAATSVPPKAMVMSPRPVTWNPAITATDHTYRGREGVDLHVPAATGMLAGATNSTGRPMVARLDGGPDPAKGSISTFADGGFDYTPKPGFSGVDTFTYVATDGVSTSDVHTVTIDVGVNHPPVAVDDDGLYSLPAGSPARHVPAAFGVLSNDHDPDGDPLTAKLVTPPTKFTLALDPDGGFTFAPLPGMTGSDTFTYQAYDDAGLASNIATVTLTIR